MVDKKVHLQNTPKAKGCVRKYE